MLIPNFYKQLKFAKESDIKYRGGKWTEKEVRSIETHFKWYIQQRKLPSQSVCQSFIENCNVKRGRTPRDIYDKVKRLILN